MMPFGNSGFLAQLISMLQRFQPQMMQNQMQGTPQEQAPRPIDPGYGGGYTFQGITGPMTVPMGMDTIPNYMDNNTMKSNPNTGFIQTNMNIPKYISANPDLYNTPIQYGSNTRMFPFPSKSYMQNNTQYSHPLFNLKSVLRGSGHIPTPGYRTL